MTFNIWSEVWGIRLSQIYLLAPGHAANVWAKAPANIQFKQRSSSFCSHIRVPKHDSRQQKHENWICMLEDDLYRFFLNSVPLSRLLVIFAPFIRTTSLKIELLPFKYGLHSSQWFSPIDYVSFFIDSYQMYPSFLGFKICFSVFSTEDSTLSCNLIWTIEFSEWILKLIEFWFPER